VSASAGSPFQPLSVEARDGGILAVCFTAMAGPCELLLASADPALALDCGRVVAEEAWRVERKFSRYRDDSITAWIHERRGTRLVVDAETAALLGFAQQCFELSEGLFDITSGVLRRAWSFDGSDRVPHPDEVEKLLPFVGFDKLSWQPPSLIVPAGMELDFGGIGKEYAVDRAYDSLAARSTEAFLVNFGGDLRASRPPPAGSWQVGIERPDTERSAAMILDLERGALATSGDSRRYLLKEGIRYGHVLDPRTGWPVAGAPRSVTVAASSCTEAGLLSTMALLQGPQAAGYLDEQGARYWLTW